MNDFIASGALHSIKLLFQKKVDRNVIIDPFSCLIKLSLLKSPHVIFTSGIPRPKLAFTALKKVTINGSMSL